MRFARVSLAIACIAAASIFGDTPSFADETVKKASADSKDTNAEKSAQPTTDNAAKKSAPKDNAETANLPEVLPPSQFFGKAQMGYAAARLCPEIIVKLFCYCGCDFTDDHHNLLDCFATDHGADCHICQEAAILALKMKRNDKPLADIQKAVDQKWEKEYPFMEPSPALKKYRASRLWKPAGSSTSSKAAGAPTGQQAKQSDKKTPGKTTASGTPKVKPGSKGSCCGGKK